MEYLLDEAFVHGHNIFFVHKGHLDVDLGEFRLTVSPEVLITEAAVSYTHLFREFNATKLQQDYLKNMGAKITSPVDVVETAFIAEYGSGKPIIGILGEFDAPVSYTHLKPIDANFHCHVIKHSYPQFHCL